MMKSSLTLSLLLAALLLHACKYEKWPPGLQEIPEESPVISPDEALDTFFLPPGYRI
jgi:hypothetical protein